MTQDTTTTTTPLLNGYELRKNAKHPLWVIMAPDPHEGYDGEVVGPMAADMLRALAPRVQQLEAALQRQMRIWQLMAPAAQPEAATVVTAEYATKRVAEIGQALTQPGGGA